MLLFQGIRGCKSNHRTDPPRTDRGQHGEEQHYSSFLVQLWLDGSISQLEEQEEICRGGLRDSPDLTSPGVVQVGDIRLSPSDIWTPDVEVYNLREGKFLASERNNRVVLYSSGKIVWVPPYHITAACSLDSTWFPFDDQKCEFKIGSWTYNGFMLDIKEVRDLSHCLFLFTRKMFAGSGDCGHFLLREKSWLGLGWDQSHQTHGSVRVLPWTIYKYLTVFFCSKVLMSSVFL